MQKSHRISGLTGGVALCALVAVLGVPFFTHQMKDILGEGDSLSSRIGAGSTVKQQVGKTSMDIEYEKAIRDENERKAAGYSTHASSNPTGLDMLNTPNPTPGRAPSIPPGPSAWLDMF